MPDNRTISQRLKELIDASSLSRIDIAIKANISKQSLYKYENGIVTNIPSDKIELLSEILGTTPAYLMGWDEKAIEEIASEREESFSEYISENESECFEIIKSLNLTDEELKKVSEFAKFIVSQRG